MVAPAPRHNPLPPSLPPRGIRREQAAAYVGVSPRKFDELVQDGRMPPAKKIDGARVWDVRQLDAAFDRLPDNGSGAAVDETGEKWEFRA